MFVDHLLTVFIQSTQILASTIQSPTGVGAAVVSDIVDGDNAHRPWDFLAEPDDVFARIFVRSQYGVQNPICPEDVVTVDGDIERMLWRNLGQHHAVLAV